MTKERVSIKKISELAGVSVATVSRVINRNGRYSPETEKRVLDLIEKFNYKPNLVAKGLRTSNTRAIGIIIPDITNEFFAQVVREIEIRFFRNGYSVIVCNTDEKQETEELYLQDLVSRGVVGMIFLSGKTIKSRKIPNLPTVFIDRSASDVSDAIVIESDNLQGGYLATKELIQHGCRRIALVRDKRNISTQTNRQAGYEKALTEAGIPLDQDLLIGIDVNYESARQALIDFLRKGGKLDGAFATTDWMALGTIDGIREMGYSIPEDVKVVGFDDISISRFSSIPFTTIHQNVDQMADKAVSTILDLIEGEPVTETHHLIPVHLIRRSSV